MLLAGSLLILSAFAAPAPGFAELRHEALDRCTQIVMHRQASSFMNKNMNFGYVPELFRERMREMVRTSIAGGLDHFCVARTTGSDQAFRNTEMVTVAFSQQWTSEHVDTAWLPAPIRTQVNRIFHTVLYHAVDIFCRVRAPINLETRRAAAESASLFENSVNSATDWFIENVYWQLEGNWDSNMNLF